MSVGSTPTAFAATDLTGVTEVHAGTYVFFDTVMLGLGVCGAGEIAMSVVVEVIGRQAGRGRILTDGGWMATSADHGDEGYGLVADLAGEPIPGLAMTGANQEHGILSIRPGSDASLPDSRSARGCASSPTTRARPPRSTREYKVVDGAQAITATWPRSGGW